MKTLHAKLDAIGLPRFVLIVCALLVALVAIPAAASPPRTIPMTGVFRLQQEDAMRPEFRADVALLKDAPRYTIKARADPESGLVSGNLELVYTHQGGETPLDRLVFRLYPNAPAFYAGGSLVVLSARQGSELLETQLADDGVTLAVLLNELIQPGEAARIRLSFEARVPEGSYDGYLIYNRAFGVMSLAGWYPVLAPYANGAWRTDPLPAVGDAMDTDISLYTVNINLPQGYTLASTGTVINILEQGNTRTYQIASGPAREFALAFGKGLVMSETLVDGVTVRLFNVPGVSPLSGDEKALKVLADSVKVFNQRFAPYPYAELDLVEVPVPIGGYEFTGMVYVDGNLRASGPFASYERLVSHEVGHQWWYGLAGNATIAEPWLDEAHANFATILYLEDIKGKSFATSQLYSWRAVAGEMAAGDPAVNSSAASFTEWSGYRQTVYLRGALFIDHLRQQMGDEAFFRFIEQYQQQYRYRRATSADYLALAQKLSPTDLQPLFERWFDVPRQ